MLCSVRLWATDVVEHDLDVHVDPVSGELIATDRITLPKALLSESGGEIDFLLNDSLRPELLDDAGGEQVLERKFSLEGYAHYSISAPTDSEQITILYRGNLGTVDSGDGGSAISGEGVQLSGSTLWYPEFDQQVRFQLKVSLPGGWLAVSQGARLSQKEDGNMSVAVWREGQPQRQIWLVANRFREYGKKFSEAEAMAFLLQPDSELAERYLDATGEYLKLYSEMIGPYPYAKFALVENQKQTGYGMPSFTLIGSRVLRLPFLLQSSYPHEILHNWWGNSVYIDYDEGNWSEGLTAYLADHLLAERQGRGVEYRRAALQKYADYVSAEKDFPLREFRSRHGDASMAVGYSKSLLFFHDLRQRLGDEAFFRALREFYKEQQYTTASWEELRVSLEKASGNDLRPLFEQWLERGGAPLLSVSGITVREEKGQYRLTGTLTQEQDSGAYDLLVPLQVTMAAPMDTNDGFMHARVVMDRKQQVFEFTLTAKPLRLEVDPDYDLFRRLHPEELPPSLGQIFGSGKITAVLPADATPEIRNGLREMLNSWQQAYPQIDVLLDSELQALPKAGAVWLLGWQNRFLPQFKLVLNNFNAVFKPGGIALAGNHIDREKHSVVLTTRRQAEGESQPLAWLGSGNADALSGLGRKLTHYGRYGYLVFAGNEPQNVLKGEWLGSTSPLNVDLSGSGFDL